MPLTTHRTTRDWALQHLGVRQDRRPCLCHRRAQRHNKPQRQPCLCHSTQKGERIAGHEQAHACCRHASQAHRPTNSKLPYCCNTHHLKPPSFKKPKFIQMHRPPRAQAQTFIMAAVVPPSLMLLRQAKAAFSRRSALLSTFGILVPTSSSSNAADADETLRRIEPLLLRASEAWGKALDPNYSRPQASLEEACNIFDRIVALDPDHTEWLEARGQVRIDAKRFEEAVSDFSEVVHRNPTNFKAYSGRALAYEGLAEWENAVRDYTKALERAQVLTGFVEPYIVNSRGNAFASLGQYQEALQDYLLSVQGFQRAKQLDGAIYAASNAALMRIQLGDEVKGMRELMGVARRAPASIDMRAALAALYWSQGLEQAAEDEWRFTCDSINPGQVFDSCALYRDPDWLRRIRRWPPIMVEHMENFLNLKSSVTNLESK